MATVSALARFLNPYLKVKDIPDSSKNGFQVRGRQEVRKLALGVDACQELFSAAHRWGADMVLVHHGLIWKGLTANLSLRKKKLAFLRKKNMSLYACHLPLDIHPEVGNNAVIGGMIGLSNPRAFGWYQGTNTGYYGALSLPRGRLVSLLEKSLGTTCIVHPFGPAITRKVGVISGGGAFSIDECAEKRIDTYITGEPAHVWYHPAKEYGLNVIYGGHYRTETVGVKALGKLLCQKFNIASRFFDIPTGL